MNQIISNLIGTLASFFRISTVLLRDNNTELDVKNKDETGYIPVRAASVKLTAQTSGNDVEVKAAAASDAQVVTLPPTDGNAGQALVTDGAGNLSYADFIPLADATATPTASKIPIADASGKLDAWISAATQAIAGLMSATDKTKLDGIEAGATADQTAAEILAALLTVDGVGSGLDADLFNGRNLSGFIFGDYSSGATLVTDYNAIAKAGWYFGGTTATGTPSANWHQVLHSQFDGNYAYQIAMQIDNVANFYVRSKIAGAWGSWHTLWHSGSASFVPTSRTISTTAPLTGGGDLSANRTLSISPATAGAAGSMSASDKSKLDGIEAGATADQTAAEILAALLTVDGAGSGLDADKIDGIEGARIPYGDNWSATTLVYDFDAIYKSGFYEGTYATGAPTDATLYHVLHMENTAADGFSVQIAQAPYSIGKTYLRTRDEGVWSSWYKLWHSGNDGAGSGLDADLIDGLNSSSLLRSDTSGTINGVLTIGKQNAAVEGGELHLEKADGASIDTIVIDHFNDKLRIFQANSPYEGVYIDLLNAPAAVAGKIWHSGNDGAGSGLDADTIDGVDLTNIVQKTQDSVINANLTIGNGTADTRLEINKANNAISDHLKFFVAGTRMGEIGVQDTTWLRINQVTAKNIYTPRMIRADGGFQVDAKWVVSADGNTLYENGVALQDKYLQIGEGATANLAGKVLVDFSEAKLNSDFSTTSTSFVNVLSLTTPTLQATDLLRVKLDAAALTQRNAGTTQSYWQLVVDGVAYPVVPSYNSASGATVISTITNLARELVLTGFAGAKSILLQVKTRFGETVTVAPITYPDTYFATLKAEVLRAATLTGVSSVDTGQLALSNELAVELTTNQTIGTTPTTILSQAIPCKAGDKLRISALVSGFAHGTAVTDAGGYVRFYIPELNLYINLGKERSYDAQGAVGRGITATFTGDESIAIAADGTYTVNLQVWSHSGSSFYCRPATYPTEELARLRVERWSPVVLPILDDGVQNVVKDFSCQWYRNAASGTYGAGANTYAVFNNARSGNTAGLITANGSFDAFTCQKAGKYTITANIFFSSASNGGATLAMIFVNGVYVGQSNERTNGSLITGGNQVFARHYLNVGDVVQIYLYCDAANWSYGSTTNPTWVDFKWDGPQQSQANVALPTKPPMSRFTTSGNSASGTGWQLLTNYTVQDANSDTTAVTRSGSKYTLGMTGWWEIHCRAAIYSTGGTFTDLGLVITSTTEIPSTNIFAIEFSREGNYNANRHKSVFTKKWLPAGTEIYFQQYASTTHFNGDYMGSEIVFEFKGA